MIRLLVAALMATALTTGGLFAQEKTVVTGIDGTFKKFEGDKVTFVPDGSTERKTCKISMDSQIEVGRKTMTMPEVMKDWKAGQHGTFFIHNDVMVNALKTGKSK